MKYAIVGLNLVVLCFACQSFVQPPTPAPGPSQIELDFSATMEAERQHHCFPWIVRMPTRLEHESQVRDLLAGLGVRDLDNFREVGWYGGSRSDLSTMSEIDEIWVFHYVITDSSGEYIPAVSGVALDLDTCESTLLKAQ